MKRKYISPETIKRLTVYLRHLEILKERGVEIISSEEITSFLNIPPAQFRKDLSYFGEFGKRGVGYNIENLIKVIKKIIGVDRENNVVVIGVGKLGSALIGYPGFSKLNINIVGAFDKNLQKIGKMVGGIKIMDIKELKKFVKKNNVKIAILSVPADAAQNVGELIVEAGIKGILNFSPASLVLPPDVNIVNVDMASELANIIFALKNLK